MQRLSFKFKRRNLLLGLVALGAMPCAKFTQGAIIYGNFAGTDVSYNNVTETPTQLPGPTPTQLFGAPTVSGDTLMFTPTNFTVGVSGGANEFQDGHLTTNILSTDMSYPKTLDITEGGGWGTIGGTSASDAMESLVVNTLSITSVNGVAINPIVVTPTITFTDTNSGNASVVKTASTIEFESTSGISTGSWNADASFNLAGALAAAKINGVVTGLFLNLDNQLAATSETNSDSFIDKKFFNITTGNSAPVPEPATGAIAAIALTGVALRRRSRVR